jgi:cyclase
MQRIAPTVYIETIYPGVNVGAIATDKGVVCIDTPSRPRDAQDWLDRIRRTIGEPIQYLILTDHQADRVFCASMFHSRGVAQIETQRALQTQTTRFSTPVLETMVARHGLSRKELNGMPVIRPQISFLEQATLQLGSHRIDLLHVPSATPGTTWVYVHPGRVLFVGDTLVIDQHPPLAEAETSNWLSALAHLQQDELLAEIIIPGRGPRPGKEAIQALTTFIETARERVCALYRAGRPRAETTSLVPDLAALFPPPAPGTESVIEWLQRQLKAGLDHLYDECRAEAFRR